MDNRIRTHAMIRLHRPARAAATDHDGDLLVPALASIAAGIAIGFTVMQGLLFIV